MADNTKRVMVPRFYVDMVSYLHATGANPWQFQPYGESNDFVDENQWYGGFFNEHETLWSAHTKYLYMNPAHPVIKPIIDSNAFADTMAWIGGQKTSGGDFKPFTYFPINFIGVLNHNIADFTREPSVDDGVDVGGMGFKMRFRPTYSTGDSNEHDIAGSSFTNVKNIINSLSATTGSGDYGCDFNPQYNGFSMFEFDEITAPWSSFKLDFGSDQNSNLAFGDWAENSGFQVGSFIVGKYWEPPHSPNLSINMTRKFDGIKKTVTAGGQTLSNINYLGSPQWNRIDQDGNPVITPSFELEFALNKATSYGGNPKTHLGKKGRRSWNLTFDYMTEDKSFIAYESSSILPYIQNNSDTNTNVGHIPQTPPLDEGVSVTTSPESINPLLNDDSFQWLFHHTLGGHIPFIFQPDNTNFDIDQYAIATFDRNSLSFRQKAPNLYTISVVITEIA